jgi:hypothetical protein
MGQAGPMSPNAMRRARPERQPRVPEIVVAGAYMFTIDVNGKISVEDRP